MVGSNDLNVFIILVELDESDVDVEVDVNADVESANEELLVNFGCKCKGFTWWEEVLTKNDACANLPTRLDEAAKAVVRKIMTFMVNYLKGLWSNLISDGALVLLQPRYIARYAKLIDRKKQESCMWCTGSFHSATGFHGNLQKDIGTKVHNIFYL